MSTTDSRCTRTRVNVYILKEWFTGEIIVTKSHAFLFVKLFFIFNSNSTNCQQCTVCICMHTQTNKSFSIFQEEEQKVATNHMQQYSRRHMSKYKQQTTSTNWTLNICHKQHVQYKAQCNVQQAAAWYWYDMIALRTVKCGIFLKNFVFSKFYLRLTKLKAGRDGFRKY